MYAEGAIEPEKPGEKIEYDAQGWVKSRYLLRNVHGELELPLGYIDKNDVLHKACAVAPMDGDDEDHFTDPKTTRHLLDLLVSCTVKLGELEAPKHERDKMQSKLMRDAISKLTTEDQGFLLIAIRRASFIDGDEYRFKITCPNQQCKNRQHTHVLNLADMPIQPAADPRQRVFTFPLPLTKKVVRYRYLTDDDTERLADLTRQHPSAKMSVALFVRIVDVDGKPLPSYFDLKKWPAGDRDALRGDSTKNIAGVDLRAQLEDCPGCGFTNEVSLEMTPSFFRPALAR